MGFYLDCHRDFDKAEYLISTFGAEPVPEPPEGAIAVLQADLCFVLVAEHPTHDAAGVIFDEREMERAKWSLDNAHIPRRWLVMHKSDAGLLCPAYALWLFKARGPDFYSPRDDYYER